MKQSHKINELENIRLLRFARNDSFLSFLREHQFSIPKNVPKDSLNGGIGGKSYGHLVCYRGYSH